MEEIFMKTGLKRGLVLGMTFCLAASSLAGCGKKKNLDTTAAIATLDGEEIPAGLANFLLRYQQAGFEVYYGSFLKAYYGDVWNSDLTGSGEAYGVEFKEEAMEELEKLLLAEKHMADYGVELTDEEKAAITDAAKEFIEENSEETLEVMSATQETVERFLTLYAIQAKVEVGMSADVDTEVSDEEAAQRTVSFVSFSQKTQEEEEASTEADTEEKDTETVTEDITEELTEELTSEAAVTEEDTAKTGAADTEAVTETDTEEETAVESASEANTEAVTEAATEEVETETETEDEATIAAKEEAKGRAEAFLETVKDVETADEFQEAATEVTENDADSTYSSYSFGADDSYPDGSIINATEGLEDNTLVNEVVEAGGSYYVLYVVDAFDEDATEAKKEKIVKQRKEEAVNALYDEWKESVEFNIDEALYAQLLFDIEFAAETEEETEVVSEEVTESVSETAAENITENISEEITEGTSEVVAEEVTEAAQTETEAVTEETAETETETK